MTLKAKIILFLLFTIMLLAGYFAFFPPKPHIAPLSLDISVPGLVKDI